MARVFVPTPLRGLAGNTAVCELPGRTVGEIIAALEARFPGMGAALTDGEALAEGLAVSINSEIATLGLLELVPPGAEVHFLPAIAGGSES